MGKKFTNEEILKAAEYCAACKGACDKDCPLIDEPTACEYIFAHHIVDTTKPAFDWDGFCKGKFAVNLRTQADYDKFMQECEERGLAWQSGRSLTKADCWYHHKEQTCVDCVNKVYGCAGLGYADIYYYKNNLFKPIIVYPTKADGACTHNSRYRLRIPS